MASKHSDTLAAEYVLGTLNASERAEAEALRASDPAFSRAVTEWEARLAPLGETVADVTPPATLWSRIEARVGQQTPADAQLIPDIAAQIDALKRNLSAWRMAAMGAGAAAFVALALLFANIQIPGEPPVAAERYVAMLQGAEGKTGFLITMEMPSRQFAIRPVSAEIPPSKSFELWAVMKDDKPPMTLGLVGTEAYAMMDAPPEIDREQLDKGIQLAISLEPEGGALKGQPMGRVVFAGNLIRQTP